MKQKYGVENSFKLDWAVEKAKETNRIKYGYDWHMQRPEYQRHYEEVMQERYGVNRALQHEEFLEKHLLTRLSNRTTPTSKPQKQLVEKLSALYPGRCFLEYPCDRCLLDIMIDFGSVKIDVEYDGKYWHQDERRDNRRNAFVKSQGYKILRILGCNHDILPDSETLESAVSELLNTKRTFIKIEM